MRLAYFIRLRMDEILKEWDKFALTIDVARLMDKTGRRDHAREMLLAIADDLDLPQSEAEQAAKSKGHGPASDQDSAAETHGLDRLTAGFSINEAVSEYRALRANVLRLWLKESSFSSTAHTDDMLRFNEAIDQALHESLASYSAEKERDTQMLGVIMSSIPNQMFVMDTGGRILYASRAFQTQLARPKGTIIGKTCSELGVDFADTLAHSLRQAVATGKKVRDECIFSIGSGRQFEYILAPVISVPEGTVDAIVVIARDITERKAGEEMSWHQANYDQLTGLPNRRLFLDRLTQDVNHSERTGHAIALLFVDLDGFKAVNDSLGHESGDALLQMAAERLNACVREADTVARLGGDEFTVLLKDVEDANQVRSIAQKIIEALVIPFHAPDCIIQISGSVGVAFYPYDATSQEGLLKAADHAMYEAKRSGRNQVMFAKQLLAEQE